MVEDSNGDGSKATNNSMEDPTIARQSTEIRRQRKRIHCYSLVLGICIGLMVEDSNGDGSKATNNSMEDPLQSQLKYLSLDPAVFNDPNFPQAPALDSQ